MHTIEATQRKLTTYSMWTYYSKQYLQILWYIQILLDKCIADNSKHIINHALVNNLGCIMVDGWIKG